MPSQTYDITFSNTNAETVNLVATGAIALAAIVIARVARAKLRGGAPEGLFVAGLSGAACMTVLARGGDAETTGISLAHALVALSAAWLLAALAPTGSPEAKPLRARRIVFCHAALLCGLLPASAALLQETIVAESPSAASVADPAVLLVIAMVAAYFTRGALSWYAVVGAAALLCVGLGGPALLGVGVGGPALLGVGVGGPALLGESNAAIRALIVSIAALVLMLLQGLTHWRFRRAASQNDSALLTRPIGCSVPLCVAVVAASVVAAACAVFMPQSRLAPFILVFAALACFNVFHRMKGAFVGETGMILLIAAAVTVCTAWLPAPHPRPTVARQSQALIGVALGGLYALWLARFWQQQLHDGTPWTSAGRLIPAARRCAAAAAIGCTILMIALLRDANGVVGDRSLTLAVLFIMGIALTIGLSRALLRDAARPGGLAGNLCAWPTLATALILLGATVDEMAGVSGLWIPFVAIAGLLGVSAARGRRGSNNEASVADHCWLGGILPVVVLYGGLGFNNHRSAVWLWLPALALLALANVRPRRREV